VAKKKGLTIRTQSTKLPQVAFWPQKISARERRRSAGATIPWKARRVKANQSRTDEVGTETGSKYSGTKAVCMQPGGEGLAIGGVSAGAVEACSAVGYTKRVRNRRGTGEEVLGKLESLR